MSRIYQPTNKTTNSNQQQAANTVSSKPVAPSNVKLYVNNLNQPKSGSISPSLPTNSSSSSSLSSSFTDKQQEDFTNLNSKTIALTDFDQMSQEKISILINRLENVTTRLETVAVKSASPAIKSSPCNVEVENVPASVSAFDDLMSSALSSFVQSSAKIGSDVKSIADLVEKLFKYERSFLLEASRSVQPSQDVLNKFYQLFSKQVEEITSFREKNRKSEFFNHLSGISESIGALGWIAVQPAPSPFVKEMSDSAQFYTNRVLKDYKEKDANHVSWVKQWLQLLSELQAYVKQYHTTGVVWNSQKKSAVFDPSRVGSVSNGSVQSGPLPPPPPPIPNFTELFSDENKKPSAQSAISTNALFDEINKGGEITSKLKKVSDDQKTHKNPAIRNTSVVPGSITSTPVKTVTQIKAVAKSPVFELDDKKWKIEYQNNKHDLVVDQTDLKHTVYIYQCKECTITVKGKVNSILIDSCNRVGLLFDDVLSTVEFINSQSVQMQVIGRVPTVTIEKTDGCQVYLSKNSLDTEIVSSKSSAMNVLVPNEHDDEFTEQPVPEQFKTKINKNRKLVTTATENC